MTDFDPHSIDPQSIDAVFQRIDRPIWIITSAAGPRRGGLVATWVSQASLDTSRPVLLAALAPTHFTTELILESRVFAAHLLDAGHVEHVWRFGLSSGRDHDKFLGIEPLAAVTGAPILPSVLAWLDCRVIKHIDAGDRLLFWADVVAGQPVAEQPTLGEREVIALASPDQLRQLNAGKLADIERLRPFAAKWRRQQG